jgi:hypothetical protein
MTLELSAWLLVPLPRYILVYPQGCDVCNHLSLFLCVADYDRLLPGKGEGAAILVPSAVPALWSNMA